MKKKIDFGLVAMMFLIVFCLSIPVTMAIGKYQVCKLYFPEMTRYVCLLTNLPPYSGVKK